MDRCDVRVIERRSGTRLTHQALTPLGGVGLGGFHGLERDLAIEARILREPHHAHAAGSELAHDVVRPDVGAGVQRYCPARYFFDAASSLSGTTLSGSMRIMM